MEWLIEGLIPKSGVSLLTGESGCGKSTFALALAGAVTQGRHFLGRETEQRDVLIVDGENGAAVLQERLNRLHIEKTPLLYVWGVWSKKLPSGPKEAAIVKFAEEKKPLIIFDSLIEFHPGSEQDASETRKYMQEFRRLSAHGATVLLIHHTGKSEGSKDYRGSSDIKASIDNGYVLTSKGNTLESLTLRPFKSREGLVNPIDIALRDGYFEVRGDHDREVMTDIVRKNPMLNQSEIISKAKGIPENKVRAFLASGVREGLLKVSRGPKNAQLYTLNEAGAARWFSVSQP